MTHIQRSKNYSLPVLMPTLFDGLIVRIGNIISLFTLAFTSISGPPPWQPTYQHICTVVAVGLYGGAKLYAMALLGYRLDMNGIKCIQSDPKGFQNESHGHPERDQTLQNQPQWQAK